MRYKKYIICILISMSSTTAMCSEQVIKGLGINSENISSKHNNDPTIVSSLKKLGEGQMKILFWKVYKAEFYSKTSPYNPQSYPKALKLTYQRDIKKQEFLSATQGEWDKLNSHLDKRIISQKQENKWLTQLSDIFPNIKESDVILFMLNKEKQANFYLQRASNSQAKPSVHTLLGAINEPTFGDYFLSIWLSENTSRPKLRKQLLAQ
jgi:hypothetical protein